MSNGSAILSLVALTRDSLGRIVSKSDSVNGTRTNWRYHYDVSGHLDSVWLNGSVSAWYGYDSNGVRIAGTGVVSASADAQDRVGYSNGITYAYDDNGQLVSRSTLTGTTRYHYTPQGELLSVVTATGDSISYTLDPAGRRIARSLSGTVTNRWLWEGSLRPVAEVDSLGNLLTRYVYATHTNVPDYLVRAGVTYRLVTDERGSVRLVVNASTGAVVSSLSYDVWGNVTNSVSPSFQPFGFAGGLRDDATNLTHFDAREYAPELGRWTRKDPIGFNGGLADLYGYVGNDPVNWVDVSGEVEINLNPNKQNQRADGDAIPSVPDMLSIVGHGDGISVFGGKDNVLSPDQLANLIRESGYWPKRMVRLYVCYAGAGGPSSFAQALSYELGVPVEAPTGAITTGSQYPGGFQLDQGSNFKTFSSK